MVNAGLTELGKKLSFQFGRHIPSHRPTRIFFSFVSRCYETAEEIRKALIERDTTIDEFEPLATIVGPQNAKDVVWDKLEPDGKNVTEFVNWWASGEFGDNMETFDEYVQRLKEDTLERIKDDSRGVLHIHVTHDLCLMSAKRAILERPLRNEDREPYLGGIGFQIEENDINLYNQGKTTRIADW
jgi:broad specificity phosphatase PhoE